MDTSLLVFNTLLPIIAGIVIILIGILFSDNIEGFLLLITHRDLPVYIREKPQVHEVLNYFKGIGILFKVLGVGLIVYGLIVLGSSIF